MPDAEKPASDPQRWQTAVICLALAAITLAVFGQTLNHPFINFDDDDYVVENPIVKRGLTIRGVRWAFSHVYASNWHPLTWISHELDSQLYGLHAGGHHLTNVLLHTATVIALFLVLRAMTGTMWRSAFVAAVFAVHPLRVESVAWIAERKDVLCGLFFVLTVGAYARYARRPWSAARYGLVLLLFAAGLMCKPMLVSLPLVLLLLDFWPLQRELPAGKLVLEKLPLLALSALSCAATLFAQHKAIQNFEIFPLPARIIAALLACRAYLVQMVFPTGLSLFYPFPRSVSIWDGVMAGLLLVVISAFAWEERRRRPWLVIGWAWYLIMLAPVVGIIQVGAQAHADRYTYLPQIGLYVAVTWLAFDWGTQRHLTKPAYWGAATVVLAVLAACAWRQTGYWKNSETLWKHTIACTTNNYEAQFCMGNALRHEGKLIAAIPYYEKALEIHTNYADALNNFGNDLRDLGRVDEAIDRYERAVKIKPSFAGAQFNLAKALSQKGRTEEAIAHYREALRIEPGMLPAHISLGTALLRQGKAEQAAGQFQAALAMNPEDANCHLNLGLCFSEMGRMADARSQYEEALRINPGDAKIQNNLAWLLATCADASLRNGGEAVELARQAAEITGGKNPVILHTLAAAYAEAGQFTEASETAQRALHLAEIQASAELATQLQTEMKLYQEGKPYHVPEAPLREK